MKAVVRVKPSLHVTLGTKREENVREEPDFADDEREKLLEFNSSCPVVDDRSVTGKNDRIDVIHIEVHVSNPPP